MLLIVGQHGIGGPVALAVKIQIVALFCLVGQEGGKIHRIGGIDILELAEFGEMIPCRNVEAFEILEHGIGGPGIIAFVASAVVHAVQLSGLGRDILHHVEQRVGAAVFRVAVGYKVVIAHPLGIACLAICLGQKISDRSSRPGSELLAFDRAEFDCVALVHFLADVMVIVVPCRYGQS